jgi:DNA-binding transcriptional ArsR family regulator
MKNDNIDKVAQKLNASVSGIAATHTYKASEVPEELDPAKLPKEIVGQLLRAGERAVLGSTSKSRKSWALLHLAICKANGLPWFGWEMKAGKVVYIDLELISIFFDRRMAAISKALNVPHPENLILWSLRDCHPKPKINELVADTIRRFKDEGVELVILEPSYKMVEASVQGTNSEMMVAQYLEALNEIAAPLQCGIITSHHSPKGDLSTRNSIDLFSGTGVWARDPDLLITMRPHEKDDHVIFDMTRRHGAPVEPLVLCWETPFHRIAHGEDPSKIRTKQSSQKTETTGKVLDVLADAPETGWRNRDWKEACERIGISEPTFNRHRKVLVEQGKVDVLDVLGDGKRQTYRVKDQSVPNNNPIPF